MKIIKIIVLFALSLILFACSNSPSLYDKYSVSSFSSNATTDKKIDYFSNFVISDVTLITSDKYHNKFVCKIKNNNSVNVKGYLQVVLYDSNKSIVDTFLLSLPANGINAGGIGVVSTTIKKSSYTSYEIYDSALINFDM
jgi:hypothetical protein